MNCLHVKAHPSHIYLSVLELTVQWKRNSCFTNRKIWQFNPNEQELTAFSKRFGCETALKKSAPPLPAEKTQDLRKKSSAAISSGERNQNQISLFHSNWVVRIFRNEPHSLEAVHGWIRLGLLLVVHSHAPHVLRPIHIHLDGVRVSMWSYNTSWWKHTTPAQRKH